MSQQASAGRSGAGQFLLWLGTVGLILGGLQRAGAPLPLFCGDWLILLLALGTALVGANWQWRDDHPRTQWTPSLGGRRFKSAGLFTRSGCHLCDEAHALLTAYDAYLPELAVIDVDSDPELQARYGNDVPVIVFDGRVRFRGSISEILLQRLIEAEPPTD